jgi:hypothetical protein
VSKATLKMSSTNPPPTQLTTQTWVAKWGFTPTNHDKTIIPNHLQDIKTRKQRTTAKEKHKNRRKRRQTLLADPLYLTKQQEYYGDNPYSPLPSTHYYLIGGNINGIPVKRSNDKIRIFLISLKSHSQVAS